jgi:hypothetical protein
MINGYPSPEFFNDVRGLYAVSSISELGRGGLDFRTD